MDCGPMGTTGASVGAAMANRNAATLQPLATALINHSARSCAVASAVLASEDSRSRMHLGHSGYQREQMKSWLWTTPSTFASPQPTVGALADITAKWCVKVSCVMRITLG